MLRLCSPGDAPPALQASGSGGFRDAAGFRFSREWATNAQAVYLSTKSIRVRARAGAGRCVTIWSRPIDSRSQSTEDRARAVLTRSTHACSEWVKRDSDSGKPAGGRGRSAAAAKNSRTCRQMNPHRANPAQPLSETKCTASAKKISRQAACRKCGRACERGR
jgi:hypothetical protein